MLDCCASALPHFYLQMRVEEENVQFLLNIGRGPTAMDNNYYLSYRYAI